MSVTSIRLQPDIEKMLLETAKKLQRSKNWLINQAIKEFLEKQSLETQRWQETLHALDSIQSGKSIKGDEVHAWLESWGTNDEREKP